jgi:hypothetical protein
VRRDLKNETEKEEEEIRSVVHIGDLFDYRERSQELLVQFVTPSIWKGCPWQITPYRQR